jgi:hypothetical protein
MSTFAPLRCRASRSGRCGAIVAPPQQPALSTRDDFETPLHALYDMNLIFRRAY